MKVLVTGGAGYVGCVLVPRLLAAGHQVVVYDIMYYGDEGLPRHPALTVLKADIRDSAAFGRAVEGREAVLHLACISNDPSFELDPALGKSINFDPFEPMVLAAKKAGARLFVYASSSSVYGVSEAPEVTEDFPLKPLSDYSRFKGMCEEILLRHRSPGFAGVVIRPATVCGYSPRMRLDLSVNLLTNLAVNNRRITVFGGDQKRPNIHVADMAEAYALVLELPVERVDGGVFNAGYQNHTIAELALMIKDVVERELPDRAPIEIATTPTDDHRSYHVCSKLIQEKLGFAPKRTIEDAVTDLCRAFREGRIPDSLSDPRYFNVKTMKALA